MYTGVRGSEPPNRNFQTTIWQGVTTTSYLMLTGQDQKKIGGTGQDTAFRTSSVLSLLDRDKELLDRALVYCCQTPCEGAVQVLQSLRRGERGRCLDTFTGLEVTADNLWSLDQIGPRGKRAGSQSVERYSWFSFAVPFQFTCARFNGVLSIPPF